jgi:hypothetical protein
MGSEKEIIETAAWNLLLGANMLEIAGLDSKDRIEAHKRMMESHYALVNLSKTISVGA